MKFKFILLLVALCFALCACGNNQDAGSNTEPPSNDNATTADVAEPTDKGLFVTEDVDDEFLKLPSDFESVQLPDDEFGDDVTGIFSSNPITESSETEPEETQETVADTEPSKPYYGNLGPNDLPDDVFE